MAVIPASAMKSLSGAVTAQGISPGDPLNQDIKRVIARYQGMISKRLNTGPIMRFLAESVIPGYFETNFTSHGRRGGGQWMPLKQATIEKKLRLVGRNIGGKISHQAAYGGFTTREAGGRFGHRHRPLKGAKHVWEPVRLTDRLFESVTSPSTHRDGIVASGRDFAIVGTKVEYARLQRRGYPPKKVPPRDFMKLLPTDRQKMVEAIDAWLWEDWIRPISGGIRYRPRNLPR